MDSKIVAVELKHAKTVTTAQLKDRQERLKPQKEGIARIINRFAYVFAEKPILNPKFPNNLNQAQVVLDIRQALGAESDLYYFDLNGNLQKI